MKYLLRLNSFATDSVAILDKHKKLVSELTTLEGPWGLQPGGYPPPDPGKELSAHFQLAKSLRGRGVRGFVSYRYRGGLRDESDCDDYVALEFNPARVDFASLIKTALPRYIQAFEPYFGHVSDEEFVFTDFDRSRNVDQRRVVLRVLPICFLSQKLCKRALGVNADEVTDRLRGRVELVESVGAGLLIVARMEPVPFETAKKLSDELTLLVGAKLD